ncbi:hypothetical protein F4774DRAFT_369379 [Daldinia eschscholtzii]|nr:hypothetical protein F4774DRAFT_369379 [Daldinia eschscholtzii]
MSLSDIIIGYLSDENFSWWTVPFAFFLALFPRIYVGILGPGGDLYDPLNPREFTSSVRRAVTLDAVTRGRIERSEYALNNAIENLPLFAIAVLAANVEELDIETRNLLCLTYILLRILYTWVYIWGQDYYWIPPFTRTLVWLAANVTLAHLYLSPGTPSNELEEKPSYWITRAIKLPNSHALGSVVDNARIPYY